MIDKMDLSNKASFIRKKLGQDERSPVDIFKLVQTIDRLTLVLYPLGENISGVCYKGNESSLIVVNSDMSIGRQRFSLAHELYHFYFEDSGISSVSLISIGKGDETERAADQFASYLLVPQSSLYGMVEEIRREEKKPRLAIEDVIKLEQYYGVSHQAMLYRLLGEGYLTVDQLREMEIGIIEAASRLGYDTTLYRPSVEDQKKMVLGHYILSAEKLLREERISQGKYEELLLDAFRADIVYGFDQEENVPFD